MPKADPKPLPKCKNYNGDINKALRGVRSLLRTKSHWCQTALAIRADGYSTEVDRDDVVAVCMVGAACRLICDEPIFQGKVIDVLSYSARTYFDGNSAVSVNDSLGYSAVMELLDHAVTDTDKGAKVG